MGTSRRTASIVVAILATTAAALAQHQHGGASGEGTTLFQSDMSQMLALSATDPMQQMSMPGWSVMDMGLARLLYNRQGGPSGATVGESTNWNMFMAQHELGGGQFTLMVMNSLEPATIHEAGSPELFQTGESVNGRALVDRQHPHDFFMHLSATYRRQLGTTSAAWIQLAPVGDPAIGPAAFMHRASAGENPTAPLGHHWQDSTHIASNVVTLGFAAGPLVVEGSAFHGREPDEYRWNIDGGRIDSASARVRYQLDDRWSAHVGYGYLHEPEALTPGNTHRITAGLYYGASGHSPWAASLVWGRNVEDHGTSDALLLEGAYQATARDHVFGRIEWVEKDADLLRTKQLAEHEGAADLSGVSALTAGYLRDVLVTSSWRVGAGVDLTAYGVPGGLRDAYGSNPLSAHVFLRVRWNASSMGGM